MAINYDIVIITSGQPSANPRVVKEAIALDAVGYNVTVIYARLSMWADNLDEELFKKYSSIKWIPIGYHAQKNKLLYNYSRLRKAFFESTFKWFGNIFNAADYSSGLFIPELLKEGTKHKADLYIGHNLGALPIVIKVAKKYKTKAAFDAEDFHRGEQKQGTIHWKKALVVENKYIPGLSYLSAASPLIEDAYKKLYPDLLTCTINNTFSLTFLQKKPEAIQVKELKLFWFSQTVGSKRGIEDIIKAIGMIDLPIHLSLLGNITEENKVYFSSLLNNNRNKIIFIPPTSELQIAKMLSEHHIGLALEVPNCLNRDFCLTNKIFFYLLAGNAIIFSNTSAQKKFLEDNPGIGSSYTSGNFKELSEIISRYYNNVQTLYEHRQKAWWLAEEKMNWEKESKILINKVREVITR